MWKRAFRALILPALVAPAATACVATVQPEPVYAEATYVPTDITVYPHVVYEGRVTYLVGGRWYYRSGPRWVYYRREPDVLYRHRVYVQQAPRAPHPPPAYEHRHYQRQPAPGVRSAPPATQVR